MVQQEIRDSSRGRSMEFYFATLNQLLTILQFTDSVPITVNLLKRELYHPEVPVAHPGVITSGWCRYCKGDGCDSTSGQV